MWFWLAAGLVAFAAACGRPSDAAGPGGPPAAVAVEIAMVGTTKLRDTSEYVSTLRSRRSVRLQPQVEGWISEIEVESGARVKAGAVIMRIDHRRQLATVRRQAADYRVTAPKAGRIGDISVRVGDLVTPQTLLATIDQNDVLEAYISVPVEQVARVRTGMLVEIIEQPGRSPAASRVSFIARQVSSDQTVLVKSKVDNRAGRLRNGQLVRARMIWGARDGPSVPVLAVQTLNRQTFVWTVREAHDGALVAEQRAVQLGPIVDQSYPVLRGLAPGDRVIIAGMQKLQREARVVLANTEVGSQH